MTFDVGDRVLLVGEPGVWVVWSSWPARGRYCVRSEASGPADVRSDLSADRLVGVR